MASLDGLTSGGWMPALWVATAASVALAAYMRILAPTFTALQAHSFFGYHVRRMKKMLRILRGDREKLARVNRVRRLDQVLPVLAGATLVGWSLHLSGVLGSGGVFPRATLMLGIAASLVAVGLDYLENARIGAMVDALPAEPDNETVRAASRITALKLWSYTLAVVILLFEAGVLLCLRAVIG